VLSTVAEQSELLMTNGVTLVSTMKAEWIKFRSVRSTILGMIVFIVLTIGLGILVTSLIHAHWNSPGSQRDHLTFDPVSTSLVGTALAQFAVGVIGSLFITTEYTTGSIRTTLAAVPNRWKLIIAKTGVLKISMLIASEAVCFAAFFIGKAIYGNMDPSIPDTLSNGADLRAVVLGGVYLTLLSVIGFSLGMLMRQSAATISTYVGVVLVIPLILFFFPQSIQDSLTKFEPSYLGREMMSVNPIANGFSPWVAAMILVIYTAVLWVCGIFVFQRRDA